MAYTNDSDNFQAAYAAVYLEKKVLQLLLFFQAAYAAVYSRCNSVNTRWFFQAAYAAVYQTQLGKQQ